MEKNKYSKVTNSEDNIEMKENDILNFNDITENSINLSINEINEDKENDDEDLNISNQIQSKKQKVITYYHPLNELNEFKETSTCKLLKRKTIKCLTYNIFLRPPGINNNGNDWKNERLDDFISIFHNYDIICLQEIFGQFNNRKEYLMRTASKAGFFFFVDTSTPMFTSKYALDSGLLILSRFPIELHSFHEYFWGIEIDSVVRKGVLYAKIRVKDTFIHLFCTHLQASYFNISQDLFVACYESRLSQIYQINDFIVNILENTGYKSNHKVLLMGDLNVDAFGFQNKRPERDVDYNLVKKEYVDMMSILNSNGMTIIDSFYDHNKYHPITYGAIDPDLGHTEKVLCLVDDLESKQCLDYIFDCYYKHNSKEVNKLKILGDTIKVEDFRLVNKEFDHLEKNRPYSQLSDHYGMSCELYYEDIISRL